MSPKLIDPDTAAQSAVSSGFLLGRLIDGLTRAFAVCSHLSWVILLAVIITNVVMRYVFGTTSVALEEMQWHLYAVGFMLGLSYCLMLDEHVRVDVLASRFSRKTVAAVDIFAMVALVIPFALIIAKDAIPFVEFSIKTNEVSRSPGGLGYRWVIKSLIPLAFCLLALAALSRVLKNIQTLMSKES